MSALRAPSRSSSFLRMFWRKNRPANKIIKTKTHFVIYLPTTPYPKVQLSPDYAYKISICRRPLTPWYNYLPTIPIVQSITRLPLYPQRPSGSRDPFPAKTCARYFSSLLLPRGCGLSWTPLALTSLRWMCSNSRARVSS